MCSLTRLQVGGGDPFTMYTYISNHYDVHFKYLPCSFICQSYLNKTEILKNEIKKKKEASTKTEFTKGWALHASLVNSNSAQVRPRLIDEEIEAYTVKGIHQTQLIEFGVQVELRPTAV